MQVTETATAGLKREYGVVVPATDLEAKVKERLDDLKGRVQLRGFRPGKVPVAHLKRIYGKSAMAEVIESAGSRGQRQDRQRPWLQARHRAEGGAADRGRRR